jgi:hypothetical protein
VDDDVDVGSNEKWAGPLLLGPFPIAIASVAVIASGSLVLSSNKGTCGYPLDAYASGVIALCYCFLIVYSWIFIGDSITINNVTVLTPFTSLASVIRWYAMLILASILCFGIGSLYLTLSSFCAYTAPALYTYTNTVTKLYYAIAVLCIVNYIRIKYDIKITGWLRDNIAEPTGDQMDTDFFFSCFDKFVDKKKSTFKIVSSLLAPLLRELNIDATPAEVEQWAKLLDGNNEGYITKDVMLRWYKLYLEKNKISKSVK